MEQRVPYLNWRQPPPDSADHKEWQEARRRLDMCCEDFKYLATGVWDSRGMYFWAHERIRLYGYLPVAACAAAKIQLCGQGGVVSPQVAAWADEFQFVVPERRVDIAAPVSLTRIDQFALEFNKIDPKILKPRDRKMGR